MKKLCIAGGVGLNSVANYKLLQTLDLEDVFVFPAAGDSGIAAGCAYWAYHTQEQGQIRVPLVKADLGQAYSDAAIEQGLQCYADQLRVQRFNDEELIERTATALAKGSIVARYEGGAEFGPRALGQRSIIADPTFLKMKDIINARVKFREAFRPFAPVIPLESMAEVFEQKVAAPFMLLVAKIKAEYQDQMPSVSHVDGTGRVQSVTAEENPFFHKLCHRLVKKRSGPPVLLNTSFNVAGQPIVETPEEAIATFLKTDIDFLAIGNYWLSKQHVGILNYEDHLSRVNPTPTPKGLDHHAPAMTEMMRQLDRAIFLDDHLHCPWSVEEVQQLASKIGQYKETSRLFPEHPYSGHLQTRLSEDIVLLLNPQGKSSLIHLQNPDLNQSYDHRQVQLLLAYRHQNQRDLDQLRIEGRQTQREFADDLQWAKDQLSIFGLQPACLPRSIQVSDSPIGTYVKDTFAPFEQESFSARKTLAQFHNLLKAHHYCESEICDRLQISNLQEIQPTHLHYYDQYLLKHDPLSDFIRLFQLRGALPLTTLVSLLGEEIFTRLCQIGLFIPRRDRWASRVDIFDVAGLMIATDHRYMVLDEDRYFQESPVMYIGMDSMGLVHTAPQYTCETLLDLCCGSGVQGLCASRYSHQIVGVDINPRAIRFSRFNAQFNGIENIEFRQGNLYEAVEGELFNTILANPPFVPSPNRDFTFRDGGTNGEDILAAIIHGANSHLCPRGRLHIVTDLVDVENYAIKLKEWWQGGDKLDQLVLGTADRNDILFSVPHSHAAFGQSYHSYCQELEEWLNNFHDAQLKAVNFGYILLQRNPGIEHHEYHYRTIHNPSQPIYPSVESHFLQRQRLTSPQSYRLRMNSSISIRQEWNNGQRMIEIFSPSNPYFTTYPINGNVLLILEEIQGMNPLWDDYVNLMNQSFIEELVKKGIVELSSETHQPDSPIFSPIASETQQRPLPHQRTGQVDYELTLEELQTKTTPTCLSSYL